jgi:hypothetical protein
VKIDLHPQTDSAHRLSGATATVGNAAAPAARHPQVERKSWVIGRHVVRLARSYTGTPRHRLVEVDEVERRKSWRSIPATVRFRNRRRGTPEWRQCRGQDCQQPCRQLCCPATGLPSVADHDTIVHFIHASTTSAKRDRKTVELKRNKDLLYKLNAQHHSHTCTNRAAPRTQSPTYLYSSSPCLLDCRLCRPTRPMPTCRHRPYLAIPSTCRDATSRAL